MTIVVTMKDADGKYILSNSEVEGWGGQVAFKHAYWKQNIFIVNLVLYFCVLIKK